MILIIERSQDLYIGTAVGPVISSPPAGVKKEKHDAILGKLSSVFLHVQGTYTCVGAQQHVMSVRTRPLQLHSTLHKVSVSRQASVNRQMADIEARGPNVQFGIEIVSSSLFSSMYGYCTE